MNPTHSMMQSSKGASNGPIGTDGTTVDEDNWAVVSRNRNNTNGKNTNNSISNNTNGTINNTTDSTRNNTNGNNWSVVNNKNTQDKVSICKHYASGYCRNKGNKCKFGLHLSEQERNNDERVAICYSYINSPYHHNIQDCYKITGGICEHCAFGDCSNKNKCIFRHDPNVRYRNFIDSISNQHVVCSKWMANIWCDGRCRSQHSGQCPDELKLCKQGKTCPSGCIKGQHQGLEPELETKKSEKVVVKTNIPLCVETSEQLKEKVEETPTYKWGSKPTPPTSVRKVKKVDNEQPTFIDNDGYECLDLFANKISEISPIKNSNGSVASGKSSKSKSKRSNKAKEVTEFQEDNDEELIKLNKFKLDKIANSTSPKDIKFMAKVQYYQSLLSDITLESDDNSSEFRHRLIQSISPAPSPLDVAIAVETTMKLNELADMSRMDSPVTIVSNSSSKKKKLSILERKRENKAIKMKEREMKRLQKVEDDDDDSDNDKSQEEKEEDDEGHNNGRKFW